MEESQLQRDIELELDLLEKIEMPTDEASDQLSLILEKNPEKFAILIRLVDEAKHVGHLGGLLDTSDIDAGGGNGKQSASRAAASFEDRATRGCRVVPIELNLTIQAGEVAVVEARLGAGVCRVDLEQVLDDGALFLQFLLRRGELATGELTQFETLDDGDIALAV